MFTSLAIVLFGLAAQVVPATPPGGGAVTLGPRGRVATTTLVRQAGQRLDLSLPPAALATATIRGTLLTSGLPLPLGSVSEVEVDPASGTMSLRIPPRETGLITVRWAFPGGPLGSAQGLVQVRVEPPNLRDGMRIDGMVDDFEAALIQGTQVDYSGVIPLVDLATVQPAGTSSLQITGATDARSVYLVCTWDDPTEDRAFDLNVDLGPQQTDGLILQVDSNGDGVYGAGDEARQVFSFLTGSGYLDEHLLVAGGPSQSDITSDGVARMTYDSVVARWTAEFLFPRKSDAAGHDADFSGGLSLPFNIVIYDGLGATATNTLFGSLFGFTGSDASGWGALPDPSPLVGDYAATPFLDDGTFVCISDHEHPLGELYELNLTTGALERLTFNERYEDWVSVAPDGSWAAYGSSLAQTDLFGFEIYTWDRSTGLETALTNDQNLDGHPAISPDGTRIAFATFDPTLTADIYLMDRDGSNLAAVTNSATEVNDPEWTKDGALVIKSSQWTGVELLGVIDLSGATELQLTDHTFSDHDGFVTADNAWVLYERFEGSGLWGADLNLTFSTPWTIRMASRDGARERLLVNDGLVNWLPVEGPDGSAMAYIVSTAFNGVELRLTDRFGIDLGRLAPDYSSFRYMDWK